MRSPPAVAQRRPSWFRHELEVALCTPIGFLRTVLRVWALLAVLLFFVACYFCAALRVAQWGPANVQNSLVVPVVFILSYSVLMWAHTLLGFSAIKYITYPSMATTFNGYAILQLFICMTSALLTFEIVTLSYSEAIIKMSKNPSGAFQDIEYLYAFLFNSVYFANSIGGSAGM